MAPRVGFEPLTLARQNLAQVMAYRATTDTERKMKATNLAQIEDYIDGLRRSD